MIWSVSPPLPLGEGRGEGHSNAPPAPVLTLTLTLSQRERGPDTIDGLVHRTTRRGPGRRTGGGVLRAPTPATRPRGSSRLDALARALRASRPPRPNELRGHHPARTGAERTQ